MAQRLAAQHVEVQVLYNLPGIFTDVGNHAVAGADNTFGLSNLLHGGKQAPKHGGILSAQIMRRCKMLLRDHQHMNGRLRLNIVEGEHMLVFEDFRRGNFAGDDFAEDAVLSQCRSLRLWG